jgi:hypothetical protein
VANPVVEDTYLKNKIKKIKKNEIRIMVLTHSSADKYKKTQQFLTTLQFSSLSH